MLPQKILKLEGSEMLYRFSWRCFHKEKINAMNQKSKWPVFLAGSQHLMRTLVVTDA